MKFVLALAFLGCLPLCQGYAGGPPDSVCETMVPNHGAAAQTSTAPYSITLGSMTYKKGESVKVTVAATASATPMKGFFIQARKSGSTDAIGTFSSGTDTEIKLMTCPGGTNNAVAHSSSVSKTSKEFMWTNDVDGIDVTFQATFVNTQTNFWTNVKSATLTSGAPEIYTSFKMAVLLGVAVMFLS